MKEVFPLNLLCCTQIIINRIHATGNKNYWFGLGAVSLSSLRAPFCSTGISIREPIHLLKVLLKWHLDSFAVILGGNRFLKQGSQQSTEKVSARAMIPDLDDMGSQEDNLGSKSKTGELVYGMDDDLPPSPYPNR